MFLIQNPDGSKMLVESLDGHEGCETLESGVTIPRVPCCERVNGSWRINKAACRRELRIKHLNSLTNAALVELIEVRLDDLEARMKGLNR